MALLPSAADYSSRDFDSLRLRLQNLLKSVFPTWTDFQVSNFGNILLEMFAHVGDILNFYQDAQAAEAFLPTATQRRSVLKLVKLLGYKPFGAKAAQASVTFTCSPAPSANVTIPAGTFVSTPSAEDPVRFQLLSPITLTPVAPSASGTVENSETETETFVSSGLAFQEFGLAYGPYVDNSLVVSAANGTFTQVDNFLDSVGTDRHFTVVVDDNDKASVKFGDGITGAIPVGTITIQYKTGGGAASNVEASTINKIEGNFTDVLGNPVTILVSNPAKASGGEDRQSRDSVKELAPLSVRTAGRTVSREDYEINARQVSGVARALMITRNEDPGVAENTGFLYVVPTGAGFPPGTDSDGTSLLYQVKRQDTVIYPCPATFALTVLPAIYVDICVTATVFLKAGFTGAQVRANIEAGLREFFALKVAADDGTEIDNPLIDFGFNLKSATPGNPPAGSISLSDIYNVIRDATGVRKIEDDPAQFLLTAQRVLSTGATTLIQNALHQDIPIQIRDFPRWSTVNISGRAPLALTNGDTGLSF